MAKAMAVYANGGATGYVTSDDERLVDLDETYEELDGRRAKDVTSGLEQYLSTGKLSRRALESVGVSGCENFDPTPSEMNTIYGGESFVTKIINGFIEFVKMIIEWIRRIINWCVSRVKILFGFQKSEDRLRATNKMRESLEKEMKITLSNLGIDSSVYTLDNAVEDIPEGLNRIEYIQTLKNKFDSEQKNVERLIEVIPLIEKAQELIIESSKRFSRDKIALDRRLDGLRNRVKQQRLTSFDVGELVRDYREFRIKTLNLEDISKAMATVANVLTDVKITKIDALDQWLVDVRKAFDTHREVQRIKLTKKEIEDTYKSAKLLSDTMAVRAPKAVDLSSLDLNQMKDLINLDDANFIRELENTIKSNVLPLAYQNFTTDNRNYLNCIELAIKFLSEIKGEIIMVSEWKNRCDALLAVYATNNVVKINKHLAELKEQGIDARKGAPWAMADKKVMGSIKEKSFNTLNLVAGLPDMVNRVNNFSKQTGLGIKVVS